MKKTILLLSLSLFLFVGCKSNYEKGIELIKEQKYTDALEKFSKIEKGDKEYAQALSKICFTKGMLNLSLGQYDSALSSFGNVLYNDDLKKTADSLILFIKNSSKYIYQQGIKEFETFKYDKAFLEFSKIPETSEEYKLCMTKIILCKANMLKKEDNLDSAKSILETIDPNDPIYPNVQKELKSIENREEFLNAKKLYESKKYNDALMILNKVDSNEDYYSEARTLVQKIEELKELEKYDILKSVNFNTSSLLINGKKYNIEMKYEGVYKSESLCDKLFKEEIKISKTVFSNDGEIKFKFEDNKKVGVSKVSISQKSQTILENLGIKSNDVAIKKFVLDLEKISLTIGDDNLIKKVMLDKNKYKIILIYKICDIDVVAESTWSDFWYLEPKLEKYYIIDENNDIITKDVN